MWSAAVLLPALPGASSPGDNHTRPRHDALHLESAFPQGILDPRHVQLSLAGLALSPIHSTYHADFDEKFRLERAENYVEAGADGIVIPSASLPSDLRQLTTNIPVPVNVLAVPELTLTQLADLGVRRVSTGSLPYRAAVDAAVDVAQNLRNGESPPAATAYPTMQSRLVEFDRSGHIQ